MKSSLVLLALIAAPNLALAQTTAPPLRVAKTPQEPMPKAQELLDNLFAPYEAAKTFRGKFDVLVKNNETTNTLSRLHLDTQFRYGENGRLERQNSALNFVGRREPKLQQTLRFVDDGQTSTVAASEQKVWWTTGDRNYTDTALSALLKPVLDDAVQALHDNPNFVPIIARGKSAGRPAFILTAKGSNVFRAVVDANSRALISFELLDNLSIRGYDQFFDEPAADESFVWTPPADFKRVEESEVVLPAALGLVVQKRPATQAAAPTG